MSKVCKIHVCINLLVTLTLTLNQPIGPVGRVIANGHKESYLRLKKWYLIPPCLTLSIIKYISKVKWSNARKRVALSLTP